MDSLIRELSHLVDAGSGCPDLMNIICEECSFIEITSDCRVGRVCKNCGTRSERNIGWPFGPILIMFEYLWEFYSDTLKKMKEDTKSGIIYWGVPKEGIATIIISCVIHEAILQEVLSEIYSIHRASGFNHFYGKGFSDLEWAFQLITDKNLKEEINRLGRKDYASYLREVRNSRNDIIHNRDYVHISREFLDKSIAVAFESYFLGVELINAEAKQLIDKVDRNDG